MRHALLIAALLLAGCADPPHVARAEREIASTEALLQAMRERYRDDWYRTLTFVQETTFYEPDGTERVQTWYEAGMVPGRLRIDIAPLDAGNAMIAVRDTVFVFREGELVRKRPGGNPLLLLGFDVYFLPVQETLAQLHDLGIDPGVFRKDTWQGRPASSSGPRRETSARRRCGSTKSTSFSSA